MPSLLKIKYFLFFFTTLFWASHHSLAQTWQIVGGGFSDNIQGLSTDTVTNSLYIGGVFKYADTITCDGIINWDGNSFTKLAKPVSNCVNYCGYGGPILRYHNRLFMMGNYGPYNGRLEQLFEYVNNNWVVSCSVGYHPGLMNMEIINDRLFTYGLFDSLCGQQISAVACFNGTDWEAFNSSNPIPSDYWINTGEYYKGQYYFGGNFEDGNFNDIMRWTGTQWDHLKTGIRGSIAYINCMKVYKDILYVGGYFYTSDGNPSDCIMAWDGANWFNPFPGVVFMNSVTDLEIIKDELYISGNYFISIPNDSSSYAMARFNGCDFNAFGGAYKYPEDYNQPRALAYLKGRIYAAVEDSLFHQSAKYLVSIPDTTPNLRTIHISSCDQVLPDFPFNLYPNPYSDNITIQLPGNYTLPETKFIITNALGQNLFMVYPESYQQLLDLSSLSSGMYFITVQDNSNKKTVKVIKQ